MNPYTLKPIGTVIRIQPTSQYVRQGFVDGQFLMGTIVDYTDSTYYAGQAVRLSAFAYQVRWSDGDMYGYRPIDITWFKETNENMLHLLRTDMV